MPCESIMLNDIEQSVARPIIFTIIGQLAEITNLSKDTPVLYAGKRSVMHTPGTTIDDATRDAVFASSRYTFVEVNEEYDLPSLQEIYAHQYDQLPIFNDPRLSLAFRPIYSTSNVTISIRYRSTSESEVRRWMSDMLIRSSRGRDINLHDVGYTYTLPDAFMGLLRDVWTLRETVAPYHQTLEQYIEACGTKNITLQANRAGQHAQLAIHEYQTQIHGNFDFVGVPDKPAYDATTATWEVSFDYKFNYQRPDAICVHYPISVHNQLLPEKYTDYDNGDRDEYKKAVVRSYGYEAFHVFDLARIAMETRKPNPYLRIPDFDDFILPTVPYGTATVYTALCFLGVDNTEPLMNLNDLGEHELDADLLEYLRADAANLTLEHKSFIQVVLYINNVQQPFGALKVTPSLDVISTKPLDPRNVHHVRFAVVIDVSTLTTEAMLKLSDYPKAFVSLIGGLNELLRVNPEFQQLRSHTKVEEYELRAVNRILTGGMRSNNYTPTPQGYRVGDMVSYTNNWPVHQPKPAPREPARRRSTTPTPSPEFGFLTSIRKEQADAYFLLKRQIPLTTMITGIIAQPKALQDR